MNLIYTYGSISYDQILSYMVYLFGWQGWFKISAFKDKLELVRKYLPKNTFPYKGADKQGT